MTPVIGVTVVPRVVQSKALLLCLKLPAASVAVAVVPNASVPARPRRDDAEVAVEVGDADLAAGDREAVAGLAELDVEVVEAERQQLAGGDGLERRGEARAAGEDAAEVELGERAVDLQAGGGREALEAGGGEGAGLVGVDLGPVERRRAAVDVEADAGERGGGERAEVQRAGEARALRGDPAAAVGGGDDRDPGAAARELEAGVRRADAQRRAGRASRRTRSR